MLYIPSKRIIEYRIDSALLNLIDTDRYLLDENLHERTIVHKFASYLQFMFRSWHVDVEYNRNIADRKALSIPSDNDPYGEHIVSVFPDIIIHRRGSNEDNLLIIEVKKSTNRNKDAIKFDKRKLKHYKTQIGYHYAYYITFTTGDKNAESLYDVEPI